MDTFVRDGRQFSWLSMQSRYTFTSKIFTAYREFFAPVFYMSYPICQQSLLANLILGNFLFLLYLNISKPCLGKLKMEWNCMYEKSKNTAGKNIPVNSNTIITLEFSSFSHFLVQRLSLLLSVFTSSSYTAESQHIKQPLISLLF